jgi:hypothetical protein
MDSEEELLEEGLENYPICSNFSNTITAQSF